jgi:DNA-binding NarL/FixJ family response regulator
VVIVTTSGAMSALACVAVTSNLRLLAETVAAALEGCGLPVVRVPWPRHEHGAPAAENLAEIGSDVALLVVESGEDGEVRAVRELLLGYNGRSLVMADSRPGPLWGAILEAGADAVVGSTTTLDEVVEGIDSLARGEPLMGVVERQVLLRQWLAARADQQALRAKIELLTPREREVLQLLHEGASAASVAERFGVSQTTVRSQIRAVLAKLEVRSQLAAVAVLESVLTGLSNEC